MFEKKILDLSDFKTQKLSEEREEKVKKKREAKKAKQKEKIERRENPSKDTMNNKIYMADKGNEIKEADDIPEDEALTKSDDTIENIYKENVAQDLQINNAELVNENDPEFIGPKLPPRMTEAEIKAFYNELMSKLKFPS